MKRRETEHVGFFFFFFFWFFVLCEQNSLQRNEWFMCMFNVKGAPKQNKILGSQYKKEIYINEREEKKKNNPCTMHKWRQWNNMCRHRFVFNITRLSRSVARCVIQYYCCWCDLCMFFCLPLNILLFCSFAYMWCMVLMIQYS